MELVIKENTRPTVPKHWPEDVKSLLEKCWDRDPGKREPPWSLSAVCLPFASFVVVAVVVGNVIVRCHFYSLLSITIHNYPRLSRRTAGYGRCGRCAGRNHFAEAVVQEERERAEGSTEQLLVLMPSATEQLLALLVLSPRKHQNNLYSRMNFFLAFIYV